jgi:septal ring-binding cell division protein DamX
MAGNGKRGGGDRVLESRHLVSLFLGVVLLCGVFFTLGYVMGHNQYGGAVHAAYDLENGAPPARPSAKPKVPEAPPAPANSEWDFYSKKNNDDHMNPVAKPPVAALAPSPAVATHATNAAPNNTAKTVPASARFQAPRMVKGSVVLQIAALTHESDALAMADALQQKRFPSFVVTPSTDNFYRVQVGPYPDEKAAEVAKAALDHAGFKAIVKH